MDIPTIAVAAGGYFGLKDLVPRILGPTADYLGGELKTYTQKGIENLCRIFGNAGKKLGGALERPGQVPPNVLKSILMQGYFCENEFAAEYLGGVLASSRSECSRDDRGAAFLSLVDSMSSYQIRTHYIAYTAVLFCDGFQKMDLDFWFSHDYGTAVLAEDDYQRCMDFSETEDREVISYHAFLGLDAKGLCAGGTEVVLPRAGDDDFGVPIRYFYPTRYGMELYLWALGLGRLGVRKFFDADLRSQVTPFIEIKALTVEYDRVTYG